MRLLERVLVTGLLVPCLGACSFDLTEVVPDARDPHMSAQLVTRSGGAAALQMQLDPGAIAGGASRMGADDSVVIRGVKHGPTAVETGVRWYDVSVLDDAGPIPVELPSLAGIEGPLTFTVPMFRIEAPDTLRAQPDGALSITIAGHDGSLALTHGSWRLVVFGHDAGQGRPLLTMTGSGQTAELHVPVMILPSGVTTGSIDVAVSSAYSQSGTPFPNSIRLHATALIPFRIDVE